MKKILSLFLAVLFLFTTLPLNIFADSIDDSVITDTFDEDEGNICTGKCGLNVNWTFDKTTGQLLISGNGEMSDYNSEQTVIPWKKFGKTVKSVVVEDGVTKIGVFAFAYLTGIISVKLPESLVNIGQYAFSGCTGLESFDIPSNVSIIGNSAFLNCTNLKTINNYSELPIVNGESNYGNICDNVEKINWLWDNEYCGSCGNTVIWRFDATTGTLTVWGIGVMDNYQKFYKEPDRPWDLFKQSVTSLVICEGVTRVGNSSFRKMEKLTSVTLPKSVTAIGEYAFMGCTALPSIDLSDTLTDIGGSAFYDCKNLKTVNNNSSLKVVKGATDNGYVGYYAEEIITSQFIIGDVNGDNQVDNLDRMILTRYLANWDGYILNETQFLAADVNKDGNVDNLDRMILTRHLANWQGYEQLPYIANN